MLVRDRDKAAEYLEAWLGAIPSASVSAEFFYRRGPAAIPGFLASANQGITLAGHPVFEAARRIVASQGVRLLQSFGATSGIAVSLKIRHGEVSRNEPCITFFVREKLPTDQVGPKMIPPEIEGVVTDIVEAGIPELHSATAAGHTQGSRVRPAEPGASVSHHRVSSGTFGCLVQDQDQRLYLLSCAHVLSDAMGTAGDAVVQPGTYFGGTAATDQIASLTRCVPLTPGVCVADAGIAEVSSSGRVTPIVRYVGLKPTGTRQLTTVGVLVQKSGDMTGHTHGIVTGLHGTVGPYSANGVSNMYFVDVIVTSGMSQPGDSGSLLMDYTGQAIGVLFGGLKFATPGSAPAYVVSWISPIDPILQNLGVSLVP